jgi:HPt (histidine-containing phosphotransfer) domain-containing protein
MASDREKCLEAGMDEYLTKPLRQETLLAVLTKLGLEHKLIPAPLKVPAVEPVATQPPVLDPAQLEQLRSLPGRNRPTLLAELCAMALHDIPPSLVRLQEAVQQAAAKPAEETAHRLAGSAANLGAFRFRAVLQAIEQAARAGETAAVRDLWPELDREWQLVQTALQEHLPPTPP